MNAWKPSHNGLGELEFSARKLRRESGKRPRLTLKRPSLVVTVNTVRYFRVLSFLIPVTMTTVPPSFTFGYPCFFPFLPCFGTRSRALFVKSLPGGKINKQDSMDNPNDSVKAEHACDKRRLIYEVRIRSGVWTDSFLSAINIDRDRLLRPFSLVSLVTEAQITLQNWELRVLQYF